MKSILLVRYKCPTFHIALIWFGYLHCFTLNAGIIMRTSKCVFAVDETQEYVLIHEIGTERTKIHSRDPCNIQGIQMYLVKMCMT